MRPTFTGTADVFRRVMVAFSCFVVWVGFDDDRLKRFMLVAGATCNVPEVVRLDEAFAG